jgi:hypothetical protein
LCQATTELDVGVEHQHRSDSSGQAPRRVAFSEVGAGTHDVTGSAPVRPGLSDLR